MRRRAVERGCTRGCALVSFAALDSVARRDVCRSEACLGCRKTRDRHARRGARHVVEARLIAEADRFGMAAVLAANADHEARPYRPAFGHRELHEAADTR